MQKKIYTILVIEDDIALNALITHTLVKRMFKTKSFYSGPQAFDYINSHLGEHFFLLIDYKLADYNAEYFLSELEHLQISHPFIIVTGKGNEQVAVNMMKKGAYDYIVKDIDFEKIIPAKLEHALNQVHMKRELEESQKIIKLNERLLLNKIVETEEKERKRFSEDIHDGVGPLLSTIKILFDAVKTKAITDINKQEEILENIDYLINDAIKCTKTIAHNLMPTILNDFGLIAALKSFIKKLITSQIIAINLQENIGTLRFNQQLEITLYRTVIELINNTLKHANANKIEIDIVKTDALISISYNDNGIGVNYHDLLTNPENAKGIGLYNAIGRLRLLNCSVNYDIEGKSEICIQAQLEN